MELFFRNGDENVNKTIYKAISKNIGYGMHQ
jgi:hypothetical protein